MRLSPEIHCTKKREKETAGIAHDQLKLSPSTSSAQAEHPCSLSVATHQHSFQGFQGFQLALLLLLLLWL